MRNILLFIFLACTIKVKAQTSLTLFRGSKAVATYNTGDNIRFKLTGEDFFYEKNITGFDPNRIFFHYFDISLDEIEVIHLKKGRKNALSVVSALAIRGGIIFMGADLINQGVVRGDGFQLSDGTWIIGGTLIGTSLLINLLSRKKFNVSKQKFRLTIR